MKAWHLDRPGDLDGLVLRESGIRDPGPHEVRVRMQAFALNNRDRMVVANHYGFPIRAGLIPLSDCAGVVTAVGAAVLRLAVGDRVSANFVQAWIGGELRPEHMGSDLGGSIDGVFAEELVFDADGLVKLAPHLSDAEGATLCCAGITAWASLTGLRPLRPGETVLVQGTGGVAIFAAQFAKLFGARVIVTTSSDAKAERLRALGVDEVINYRSHPDWDRVALDVTGGRGVDRLLEIGGPSTFEASLRAVRIGGRISVVGFSGGIGGRIDPLAMIGRGIGIDNITVGSRDDFEAMMRAVDLAKLHPVIDRTFGFGEARVAFEHLAAQQHIGKVVLKV